MVSGNSTAYYTDQLITIVGLNAFFVAIAAYFLRRNGSSLTQVGLMRPTRRQILLGLGLGLFVFVGALAVSFAQEGLLRVVLSPQALRHLKTASETSSAEGAFHRMPTMGLKFAFAIVGTLIAPMGEEIFFRGFVYNSMKRRLRVPGAIFGSALLFALVHISPLVLVVIFLMGLLFASVYEQTGSLWVPIIIHIVNNSLAFVLLAFGPS